MKEFEKIKKISCIKQHSNWWHASCILFWKKTCCKKRGQGSYGKWQLTYDWQRHLWNIYQLYFYVNLFNPLEDSSIINEKTLNKNNIEKLLNEILSTNKQNNEKIESVLEENDIKEKYWVGT